MALRQPMSGTSARLEHDLIVGFGKRRPGHAVRDARRHLERAQAGEHARYRLGIAEAAEDAVDASRPDRRKELLEVQAQHDLTRGVRAGAGERRATRYEAVSRGVGWNQVEDLVQHALLKRLQA